MRRATGKYLTSCDKKSISIHALREEGDTATTCEAWQQTSFLSTPSVRRATVPGVEGKEAWDISIHALREEGD